MIITIDLNLVIIENNGNPFNKPERIVRLPLSTANYLEKELIITWNEIKFEYVLFNNLDKYSYKFENFENWIEVKEKLANL